MPQLGRTALEGLPEVLAKIDKLPQVDLPPPNRQEQPMVRNGGHLLLGTEGLNCISCHNYNGKESPGMKGYDLILTYQRLQPGWFYEFMKNPAKHRPRNHYAELLAGRKKQCRLRSWEVTPTSS